MAVKKEEDALPQGFGQGGVETQDSQESPDPKKPTK